MKIGFICLPMFGHLNPMIALARRMRAHGEDIVFFGIPDVMPTVSAAGLPFVSFCEEEYPVGSLARLYGPLSGLQGQDVLRVHMSEITPLFLKNVLRRLPQRIREAKVEGLVIDSGHSFVQLAALAMVIPFVQVWNPLHIDRSAASPPCVFDWPYENTGEARERNRDGLKQLGQLFGPTTMVAKEFAAEVGLELDWSDPRATTSQLAVLTQTPEAFDFPGIPWPLQFLYAGPFQDEDGRVSIPFPWERLTGDPIVYASLGTVVNGIGALYRAIVAAVARIPSLQLVLSVGQNIPLEACGTIPADTIVVRSAPQLALLDRAAICITHAGLNTALEAIMHGVPMVAIPISHDQPGVAARIRYHGLGDFINPSELTVDRLEETILRVLKDPRYLDHVEALRSKLSEQDALDIAVEAIVRAFRSEPLIGAFSLATQQQVS